MSVRPHARLACRLAAVLAVAWPAVASAAGRPALVGDVRFPHVRGLRESSSMTGKVAVAAILVESDGTHDKDKYDWTTTQRTKVQQQVEEMIAWFNVTGASYGLQMIPASVHFCEAVATGYEPLGGKYSSEDECLWVDEVMTTLGFTSGACEDYESGSTNVDAFNEAVRVASGADAAYTLFILNDGGSADPPTFTDDGFAWAYWGGPWATLTYGNGGWGIDSFAPVAAHESAHIFHALDEYSDPGYSVCWCSGYHDYGWWEYNGCANDNCQQASGQWCKAAHEPCIMGDDTSNEAYDAHQLCAATRCHVGWLCTTEVCDGVDNDCDGSADEPDATGCATWFHDGDGDGYGPDGDSRCLCGASGSFTAKVGGDCADDDPLVNPGALEQCDGADEDCDGAIDNVATGACTPAADAGMPPDTATGPDAATGPDPAGSDAPLADATAATDGAASADGQAAADLAVTVDAGSRNGGCDASGSPGTLPLLLASFALLVALAAARSRRPA